MRVQNNMTRGIVYYNSGLSCLVRLAVSIYSLRKYYSGNVTVLCDDTSYAECSKLDASVVNIGKEKWKPPKEVFFNKCFMHELSPYDTTIYFDCDTVIYSKRIEHLFNLAEKFQFVATQFCEWTTKDKHISVHLTEWGKILGNEIIDRVINFGPVINAGVFAFIKESKLFSEWFNTAIKGVQFNGMDETALQILLHKYQHYIVDHTYNESSRRWIPTSETKILHFHGRNHCKVGYDGKNIFSSQLWYKEFDEIKNKVNELIKYDPCLFKYLPIHEATKQL